MEPSFSFVDVAGSALSIDAFCYQFPTASDQLDANWLCCRISLSAVVGNLGNLLEHSLSGFLRTEELRQLAETLQALLALDSIGVEVMFEPTEPYVKLLLRREEKFIQIDAVIDLDPCVGPEIRVSLKSRLGEIQCTLDSVRYLVELFPEKYGEAGQGR